MNLIKKYFSDWDTYEKIWLFLFTFIIIGLSFYWKDSLIGILASLTGIWCVGFIAVVGGSGQLAMGRWQWADGNGQLAVGSWQWAMSSGQLLEVSILVSLIFKN